MLLPNRKQNQCIVIDSKITLVIDEIAGGRIKVGIDAPRDTPVVRDELAAPASQSSAAERSGQRGLETNRR